MAYYGDEKITAHQKQSDIFTRLQKMNRRYEKEVEFLKMRKVNFRNYLDIVYPCIDECFKGKSGIYGEVQLEILKKYPHPALLLKHREETVTKTAVKKTNHNRHFVEKIVHKMYERAKHCYSGADPADYEVIVFPAVIEELQDQLTKCEVILKELICEAEKVPYFECVASIVGIGENLAARLIGTFDPFNGIHLPYIGIGIRMDKLQIILRSAPIQIGIINRVGPEIGSRMPLIADLFFKIDVLCRQKILIYKLIDDECRDIELVCANDDLD